MRRTAAAASFDQAAAVTSHSPAMPIAPQRLPANASWMLQAQCKGASLRPPLASGPRIKPGCVECGYTIVAALTTSPLTPTAHAPHDATPPCLASCIHLIPVLLCAQPYLVYKDMQAEAAAKAANAPAPIPSALESGRAPGPAAAAPAGVEMAAMTPTPLHERGSSSAADAAAPAPTEGGGSGEEEDGGEEEEEEEEEEFSEVVVHQVIHSCSPPRCNPSLPCVVHPSRLMGPAHVHICYYKLDPPTACVIQLLWGLCMDVCGADAGRSTPR